jgi:ribonuclease HI
MQWEKPKGGWMKLNVDGSFDAQEGRGGIGMILRDNIGKAIFSSCRVLDGCSDAQEAELLSCAEGIILVIQWTLLLIVVETDCLVASQLIQSKEKDLSTLAHIVQEVKRLLAGEREIIIQKIHRSQNHASHALAKARSEFVYDFWLGDTCNFISHLICTDALVE